MDMCAIKVLLVGLFFVSRPVTSTPPNYDNVPPSDYPTTPNYDYDYDYDKGYNEDAMDYFHIDNSACTTKAVCEADSNEYQNYPGKNCFCDSLCLLLRDCCPGYMPPNAEVPALPPSTPKCVRLEYAVKTQGIGVYMVSQCAADWPDDEIKANCEFTGETNDTQLILPVTETKNKMLFGNMYCAYCNKIYDFKFWQIVKKCKGTPDSPDSTQCKLDFENPFPKDRLRMCPLRDIIEDCEGAVQAARPGDVEGCRHGSYSLVHASCNLYRNRHCAACHGVNSSDMYCERENWCPTPPPPVPDPREKSYSFRMVVDLNSGHLKNNDGQLVGVVRKCKDDEMYDPLSDKCREILCPSPLIPERGVCVGVPGNSSNLENCTLAKLEPSEYELINGSQVRVFSSGKVYNVDEFHVSGSDVFICMERNQTCRECATPGAMFTFDEVESYLSLVTLIVSLASLALTFAVYIYFNELLNTPGKILISLIISLFLAQLMFLISPSAQGHQDTCRVVSVIMHYFFLAAFCWMNVVALDLWMTFSNQFISPGSGSKSFKRFLKFSIYGWFVPLLIVCIAIIVDLSDIHEDHEHLKPRYGVGVCWITSRDGLLLFFAGPLAVFKLFDIVAFIFTSIHIIRAKRQSAMARQEPDTCSFFVNVKLALVMGLTWVFAFVANIGAVSVLWYLFIVFNCLQGLFIAVSFLCTNKVQRLVRNKYEEVSGSGASSTGMTSLTPSGDRK